MPVFSLTLAASPLCVGQLGRRRARVHWVSRVRHGWPIAERVQLWVEPLPWGGPLLQQLMRGRLQQKHVLRHGLL